MGGGRGDPGVVRFQVCRGYPGEGRRPCLYLKDATSNCPGGSLTAPLRQRFLLRAVLARREWWWLVHSVTRTGPRERKQDHPGFWPCLCRFLWRLFHNRWALFFGSFIVEVIQRLAPRGPQRSAFLLIGF